MTLRTGRGGAIEAGAIAGVGGLAVFLVLHHLWIVPIWFIAPVGAVMAAIGGAAVGAAYGELLPRLPPRPWTSLWVMASVAAILTPSFVAVELSGPIYAMGLGGEGTLLVSAPEALTTFVVGLVGTATLTGAALGATIGRTRRAAAKMALAGLALALGPGHNIPLLGGTPAAVKELAVLAIVVGVASLVLVESQVWMTRWAAPSASIP